MVAGLVRRVRKRWGGRRYQWFDVVVRKSLGRNGVGKMHGSGSVRGSGRGRFRR